MVKRKDKSANLIEAIVVVIVVGFLGMVTWYQFEQSKMKSRDTKRKSDIHELGKVLRMYYTDYKSFPDPKTMAWGKEFKDGDYTYMKTVPIESYLSDKPYCYEVGGVKGAFARVYAQLENKSDPECLENFYTCEGVNYCYTEVINDTNIK